MPQHKNQDQPKSVISFLLKPIYRLNELFFRKLVFNTSFELFNNLNQIDQKITSKTIILDESVDGFNLIQKEFFFDNNLCGIFRFSLTSGEVIPGSINCFLSIFVDINGMTKADYFEEYDRFLESKKNILLSLNKKTFRYKLYFPQLGKYLFYLFILEMKSICVSNVELNSSSSGYGFYTKVLNEFKLKTVIKDYNIYGNKFIIRL